jgi:hypothetical protein
MEISFYSSGIERGGVRKSGRFYADRLSNLMKTRICSGSDRDRLKHPVVIVVPDKAGKFQLGTDG